MLLLFQHNTPLHESSFRSFTCLFRLNEPRFHSLRFVTLCSFKHKQTRNGKGGWNGNVGEIRVTNEPTWRCHQNPFVGALGIQEPVILGEPQIKG